MALHTGIRVRRARGAIDRRDGSGLHDQHADLARHRTEVRQPHSEWSRVRSRNRNE